MLLIVKWVTEGCSWKPQEYYFIKSDCFILQFMGRLRFFFNSLNDKTKSCGIGVEETKMLGFSLCVAFSMVIETYSLYSPL